MIRNVFNGVSGYISYRGGAGHLAFVMHRVSGLGTLLFLSMHIVLESTAHFAPHLYDKLNAGLRNPFALAAEILLAFFVIFHGVNGFRIAYFDLFHLDFWSPPSGPKSARATWMLAFILWLPALIIMILHGLQLI
jgi:succinate dehydrogenase / fumarate reductase cytochrome b subunit